MEHFEHFSIGDIITPLWGTGTFYDDEHRPDRVRAGSLTQVLEAEPYLEGGARRGPMGGLWSVTLLLPSGKTRRYRSMDPRYWQRVTTTA